MSESDVEHLVTMANQIAEHLSHGVADDATAADKTVNHIKRFWARSMKQKIKAYATAGGAELSTVASLAVERL